MDWASQFWGPSGGDKNPWLIVGPMERKERRLNSVHEKHIHTHTGLTPRQGRERSALEAAGFPTSTLLQAPAQNE